MRVITSLLLTLALGCGGNAAKPAREDTTTPKQAATPPLELPAAGASVQLVQRTSAELPGSNGVYTIGIDDITAGQVGLTIGRKDGSAVLVSKSVRPKETVPFTIDAHRYEVVVEALDNQLVGHDTARLLVRAAAGTAGDDSAPAKLSETARIEALIAAVEASGIVFIRNGSEHSASDAAAHLRSKWSRAGDRVTTAESFIDVLASTSSQSGDPYRVRLPDGTERDAGPWLHAQLQAIDAKG
ncbi:MAG TPA: DUF5329 domain-containing protein [Nannocystaceae bacterium]|nr:DUF5329 domain-containing protein [Nannocystaceae bacterium]